MAAKNRQNDPASEPSAREREILAANVETPVPLNGPIHLEEYNPEWPAQYDRLAREIRDALGERLLLIAHVGSTSVPALAAKPIIDVVVAVADSADEPSYVPALEACGYRLTIREPDWFEHRLLKPPAINGNIHLFSAGCEEIERMIRFRDWLRTHESERLLYESAKRRLAAQEWTYVQQYADAKSEVIGEIMGRAGLTPS